MKSKSQSQRICYRLIALLVLLVILLPTLSLTTSAQDTDRSNVMPETQILEEDETIDGPGFFSGDIVQIDGTVNGTTFAAGQSVRVSGTINGSLFLAGQTLILDGEVTGNVYGAGQTITVSGQHEEDSFLAGATITVDSQAQMGRDLFLAGSSLSQDGQVSRHLYGAGEQLALDGVIGGNALLDVERLTLEDAAVIEGDLTYQSPNEANVDTNATINGQTDWQRRASREQQERPAPTTTDKVVTILLSSLWSILSALLVWLFIKLFHPGFWMDTIKPIARIPIKTMGFGLLALIGIPILAILLLITIIGIPLALILLVTYAASLYLTKIVVAVFLGSWLALRFRWDNLRSEFWPVLLGLVLLELVSLIPFVGFLIGLIVVITGLGALFSSTIENPRLNPLFQRSNNNL